MPCILCRRFIAALPLPVCTNCREARSIKTEEGEEHE